MGKSGYNGENHSERRRTLRDQQDKDTVKIAIEDTSYKDEVGGIHDEGLGWNPQGHFCGECGNLTCKGCSSEGVWDDTP
jgi:hypothetical protein